MLDSKWLSRFHFHRISVRLCFEQKECHHEDVCNDHPNYSERQYHSRISIFDKIYEHMKMGNHSTIQFLIKNHFRFDSSFFLTWLISPSTPRKLSLQYFLRWSFSHQFSLPQTWKEVKQNMYIYIWTRGFF